MMKKFVMLLYCCFPFFLFGQSGFNTTYDFSTLGVNFSGVVAIGDSLVVFGDFYNPNAHKWNLFVSKLDTMGNIANLHTWDMGWNTNTLNCKMILTTEESTLIHANVSSKKGFALKLNQNLEEEFFTVFDDTINRVVLHREVVEVSDGYIIGGEVQYQNYDELAWASKLDYEGNVLWYREYGTTTDLDTLEDVFDMAVTVDGNVMITGNLVFQTWQDGEMVYWSKPWYLIIDSDTGEIIWERKYAPFAEERVAFAIEPMEDGSYLTGGSFKFGEIEGYPFFSIDIRRLDANGDLIWRKPFGPVIQPTEQFVFDILPLPDGRYAAIAQGDLGIDFSPLWQNRAAITIVFDPEDGTESWVRVDTIPSDTIDNRSNYVQGGTVLSSGSIVVAGYNNDYPAKGWLIKMDKNGCIQDDCAITATVEIPAQQPTAPLLYPNPASDFLHVDGAVHSDLWIEDMQGRLLRIIPRAKTGEAINVQNIPTGVYLLRGKTDGVAWVLKWLKT